MDIPATEDHSEHDRGDHCGAKLGHVQEPDVQRRVMRGEYGRRQRYRRGRRRGGADRNNGAADGMVLVKLRSRSSGLQERY